MVTDKSSYVWAWKGKKNENVSQTESGEENENDQNEPEVDENLLLQSMKERVTELTEEHIVHQDCFVIQST
jgi:hypothetical protein